MALQSALEAQGRLPGQKKLVVGSEPGPTAYAVGGIPVRLPLNTLTSNYDVISVYQKPDPHFILSVAGWAGNVVNVKLGCEDPGAGSCFVELPNGYNVSSVSVFVAAMGR